MTNESPRLDELPAITDEDRELLHYNPNTDDLVAFVQDYARKAIEASRAVRAEPAIVARPLEWEEHQSGQQWTDKRCGFCIIFAPEDDADKPFNAAWGEGDSESFATLDEAKEWCQKEIDGWIAQLATLATHQPQAAESAAAVLRDIVNERARQDGKWGGPEHDDQHSVATFVQLIEDYAGWARVMAGMDSMDKARRRLVQVAALAAAAVECIDRNCLPEEPSNG